MIMRTGIIPILSRCLLILAASVIGVLAAQAIPAYPGPIKVTQPDGTTLTIRLQGDEHGYMAYTDDGFPVVQNAQTGAYEYARLTPQGLVGSGIVATPAESRTAQVEAYLRHVDIPAIERRAAQLRANRRDAANPYLVNDFPTRGTQRTLVILVEFSDTKFTSVDNPYAYYHNMLNQEGFTHVNGANGSARDYYHACSNGQFDPQFDVVGPVQLLHPQSYYGGDSQQMLDTLAYQMVIDACLMLDDEVDFSQYDLNGDGMVDNIYFFYAGFGQADSGQSYAIWPHAGKINEDWHQEMPQLDGVYINRYAASNEIRYGTGPLFKPVGIGTFVHEFAHVLGLVDHYDTGYGGGFHPGIWDVMAAGSYNDNQNTPPAFSAFERAELGWLEYTDITPATPGLLNVHELQASNSALRLVVPDTEGREFFIFENRQQMGWDSTLPGHGMLVWHIDRDLELWHSNKANADAAHQRIDIVEADRVQTNNSYGGDPFPGTGRVTTYDFMSWARENIFSFDLVEETDTTVNFLLARTDYKPTQPQIVVEQVLGTSLTFTWGAVADAKEYLVTVEQIEDGMPVAVDGFDHKAYIQPESVQVTGLSPMTQYRITVVSRIASYESEPATLDATTTDIQFVETAPVATPATQITATGFTAHWLPLDGAEGYMLTVYNNVYSDTIAEGYGFDTKAEGMPQGWNTNSTQYSSVLYGESKPSLQLSKQDDYLSFDYGDNKIVSLKFWQRSQMSSNQLVIEQRAGDEWLPVQTMNMSSQGEVVTVPIDSAAQVRIRFERKGSYAVIDDVQVAYITLDQSPVDGFVGLAAGNGTSLVIQDLPPATSFLYRVQGVQDGQLSAPSNAVLVMMVQGVPGDVNGDNEVNIADVNAVIDMILSGKTSSEGDVNRDGEVNIADVNAVIDMILNQ